MKRTHLKLVIIAVLVFAFVFSSVGCQQRRRGFVTMNLISEFHITARDTLK